MPHDPVGFGLRIAAFALVIAAASLTPPPGAEEEAPDPAAAGEPARA
jgi:hypothetical protein